MAATEEPLPDLDLTLGMARPPIQDDGRLRCGNASRGVLVARDVRILRGRWDRFRQGWGRPLPEGSALYLAPALAVHGCGSADPLRVLFLDESDRVLAAAALRPWEFRPAPGGCHAALLLPPGRKPIPALPGDRLEWLRGQPRIPGRGETPAPHPASEAPFAPPAPGYPAAMPPLLRSLRPRQWMKNLVVFAALAFRSGSGLQEHAAGLAIQAFLAFCMVSSAVYLFNDVLDRDRDRLHPVKRHRPIAAGAVSPPRALWTAFLLATAALLLGAFGGAGVAAPAGYLVLQLAYTLWLKHLVILDVFGIAAGFLLRVLAGVWAIDAPLSPWLVACSVELALFLALCKRKAELITLDGEAAHQRPLLGQYSGPGLDVMVAVAAAATVVTYGLYTLLPGALLQLDVSLDSQAGRPGMVWTFPFVLYGVMRYLHLVYRGERGERPERVLLTDPPLLLAVGGYLLVLARILSH